MNTANAGWVANRRYKEANEFGLYNGTTTDINTDRPVKRNPPDVHRAQK